MSASCLFYLVYGYVHGVSSSNLPAAAADVKIGGKDEAPPPYYENTNIVCTKRGVFVKKNGGRFGYDQSKKQW